MLKAVVLAAGQGVRLKPFTETRPKPLIPIVDRPLLDYTLERLKSVGVSEVLVVGSYMVERLREYLEKQDILNWRLILQPKPRGTGDALKYVEGLTGEKFILVYGDVLVSKNVLERLVKLLNVRGVSGAILGVEVENPWEYGVLKCKEGELVEIVEKPSPRDTPSKLVNGGVYLLSKDIFEVLEDIEPSERGELELTEAINSIVSRGVKFRIVKAESREWFELGKPWDILRISRSILRDLKGEIRGYVEEGVKIVGPVYVGEDAEIKSGAYIVGPTYIGDKARVGPNCYVREYSVIGKSCRVGNAVEIKASILMENAHVGHLSYIGDSVIGESVNLGAGTVTANLRFDDKPVKVSIKGVKTSSGMRKLGAFIGDHVKTGINVSLMPGVKIGSYSTIYPGLTIYEDVPSKSIVKPASKGYVVLEDVRVD